MFKYIKEHQREIFLFFIISSLTLYFIAIKIAGIHAINYQVERKWVDIMYTSLAITASTTLTLLYSFIKSSQVSKENILTNIAFYMVPFMVGAYLIIQKGFSIDRALYTLEISFYYFIILVTIISVGFIYFKK